MGSSPSKVTSPNAESSNGVPNRIRVREDAPPVAGYPWVQPWAVKVCGKCQARYHRHEWVRLRFVGVQLDLTDPAACEEMRDCTCGNTLAVTVSVPREVWTPGGAL